jgi:hypothetical protein
MRGLLPVLFPYPGPLPEGEGEKRCALFTGRVNNYAAGH